MAKLTIAAAKAEVKALGTVRLIRKIETNEFVVRLIGRPEADYCTCDLQDAVDTAKAMDAQVRAQAATKVVEAAPAMTGTAGNTRRIWYLDSAAECADLAKFARRMTAELAEMARQAAIFAAAVEDGTLNQDMSFLDQDALAKYDIGDCFVTVDDLK